MFLLFVFALLIQNSVQQLNNIDSGTGKDEKLSGLNVIYFEGPPPSAEQIRSVREILKTDVLEADSLTNVNPVVRHLISPNIRHSAEHLEMNKVNEIDEHLIMDDLYRTIVTKNTNSSKALVLC